MGHASLGVGTVSDESVEVDELDDDGAFVGNGSGSPADPFAGSRAGTVVPLGGLPDPVSGSGRGRYFEHSSTGGGSVRCLVQFWKYGQAPLSNLAQEAQSHPSGGRTSVMG
jgi:hypothetical protein